MRRFTSRKFLVALVTAIYVALAGADISPAVSQEVVVAAIAAIYIVVEGIVDIKGRFYKS